MTVTFGKTTAKNNRKIISSLTSEPWKGYEWKVLKVNISNTLKLEGLSKNKNKNSMLSDLERKIYQDLYLSFRSCIQLYLETFGLQICYKILISLW